MWCRCFKGGQCNEWRVAVYSPTVSVARRGANPRSKPLKTAESKKFKLYHASKIVSIVLLSLLLLAWPLSFFFEFRVAVESWQGYKNGYIIIVRRGAIRLVIYFPTQAPPPNALVPPFRPNFELNSLEHQRNGVSWAYDQNPGNGLWFHFESQLTRFISKPLYREMIVPIWFIALFLAVPLIYAYKRPAWRRQRLARQGRCIHCGYDLRASGERCPECGAMVHLEPGN